MNNLMTGMAAEILCDLVADRLDLVRRDLSEDNRYVWEDQDGDKHLVFGPEGRAKEYAALYGSIVPGPAYKKIMAGLGALGEVVDERVDTITLYSLIRLFVGTEAVALQHYYYILYTA